MTANDEKTLAEHFSELRYRLLCCTLSIFIGGIAGYFYNKQILAFLTLPLGKTLYYTSPTGGFDLVLKISILFGVLVSFPIVAYQLLRFIQPAIPQNYKISIEKFLFASWSLLMIGVALAYYLSLPAALRFLSEFGSDQVQALITAQDYFSFALSYLGGFGLMFQLPIVMVLIHKINPLNPKKLLGYWRYVALLSFLIAAILTPTADPINQTIMALPIILLYTLSIGVIALSPRPAYAQ